jgi:hypothetical protein
MALPETIGAAIIEAGYWIAGTSVAAEEAAGYLTVLDYSVLGISAATAVGTTALIGLDLALQPGAPTPQTQKANVRTPIQPRRRGYGTVKLGGAVAFLRRSTVTGDGILYLAVMIHSGEIDSIIEQRIYDQLVRTDDSSAGDGEVVYPGVWLDNNRVTIHHYTGLPAQTADPLLIAAFPGAWTAEHSLDGIAYVVIKANGVALEDFGAVYKAGIPSYNAVIQASKLWDPRISGCDADDPTTWVWSDNAALIVMDYVWNSDGMRLPRSMIELAIDRWIAVANCCDEEVPLLSGGTEKRYRLSGVYDFSEPPKNVLARMLAPIDGRLHLRADGAIVLDIGEFCEPAITIADADILSYDLRRGPEKMDLKNEIRATYTAPGLNYEQQEADPWRDEDSILVDGLQSLSINLDWCPSHSQARRMMKVNARRQNPQWQGSIVTNARGALLLGQRYARFQIADLALDTTFLLQKPNIDLLNGICTFDVIAFTAEAYDFAVVPGSGVFVSDEGVSPEANSPGDHGIVVPEGATSLVIVADGGGGGGSDRGAGGGARCVKTIAVDPADWGAVILYHVGAGGIGDAVTALGVESDGEDSTVTGSLAAGAIAMTAGGGKKGTNSPGAGGAASGGDATVLADGTSTGSGTSGSGPDGGPGRSGADANAAPGGGGDLQMDGANGSVTFTWTPS